MIKKRSRILDEMQETAEGLLQSKIITQHQANEITVLCQTQVTPLSSSDIKQIRESLHVSQSVFASILNISPSTVQKWEIGDKRPSGSSLKLLNIVKRHGLSALA